MSFLKRSYIWTIMAKFCMDESRPAAMPMVRKLHKSKHQDEACDPTVNESRIRRRMYLMTTTRPDITYAMRVFSRYNHTASIEHMVAPKCVFCYLDGTKDWHLHFWGALEWESAQRCYVNPDCTGSSEDFKLTSWLDITFGGAVDWGSSMQRLTTQYTTDAEYYAFGAGRMRPTQNSEFLYEFGIPTNLRVFSNSQSQNASIKKEIYRRTVVALNCDQVLPSCRYA